MNPADWAQQSSQGPLPTGDSLPKKKRYEKLDFSRSSALDVPSLNEISNFKIFRIIRKDGVQIEELIRIAKSECSSILEKVAKRFKISLKEVVIYYSLPTSTGEEKEMQLVYVDDKESNLENQELFYSLAPETQLITVHQLPKQRTRKERHIENIYKKYTNINTTNSLAYEVLKCVPRQCEIFILKRKIIQVAMGSPDCVNLLCPSRFKCFVSGCLKPVLLKSFSSLTSIKTHLKTHFGLESVRSNSSEGAEIVHRRMKFIEATNFVLKDENTSKSNDALIEEINTMSNDAGLPLKLTCPIQGVHTGGNFRGAHYEVDLAIIKQIAEGDFEVPSSSADH